MRGGLLLTRSGCSRLRFRLHDIDAALKIRAIFNDDAGSFDIAHQPGIFADLDSVTGLYISLDRPENHDFPRFNGGMHLSIWPDGQFVLNQLDGALYIAIDIKVLLADDLTVDLDGLSDGRGAAGAVQVWTS
jgi:hypothetical protein